MPSQLPKSTIIRNGLRSNYYKTLNHQDSKPTKFVSLITILLVHRSFARSFSVVNVARANPLARCHRSTGEYSNLMMTKMRITTIDCPTTSIGSANNTKRRKKRNRRSKLFRSLRLYRIIHFRRRPYLSLNPWPKRRRPVNQSKRNRRHTRRFSVISTLINFSRNCYRHRARRNRPRATANHPIPVTITPV